MPIYEYACRACGEHLEVAQSFRDDPLTTCPGCGGSLRKVFGSIGITFKGSGFYRTDSRPAGGDGRSRGKEAEGKDGKDKAGEKSGAGSGEGSKEAKSGDAGAGGSGTTTGGTGGKAEAKSA